VNQGESDGNGDVAGGRVNPSQTSIDVEEYKRGRASEGGRLLWQEATD